MSMVQTFEGSVVQAFLDHHMATHGKAGTIICYAFDLWQFCQFLTETSSLKDEKREKSVKHILSVEDESQLLTTKREDVLAYIGAIKSNDVANSGLCRKNSTLSRKLATLRTFFRFCERQGKIASNPTAGIKKPAVLKKPPHKCIGDTEITKLLNALDSHVFHLRDRCIINLMYSTGMRTSEIAGLNVGDIDFATSTINVKRQNGSYVRELPATEATLDLLTRYLDRRGLKISNEKLAECVFANNIGERISERSITKNLRGHFRRANLHYVSPKVLRHSFLAKILREGASRDEAKERFGVLSNSVLLNMPSASSVSSRNQSIV